jgi:hypothetical protein
VSVEGISGAGKTSLTKLAIAQLVAAGHQVTGINDFSARSATEGADLGREFLHALIGAADGDRFLRGGHLHAETLLLLAIKTYDYEATTQAASAGQITIDGRSLDTTAVYQSVLISCTPAMTRQCWSKPAASCAWPGNGVPCPTSPFSSAVTPNSRSTAPASATSGRSHPRSGLSNCAPTASTGS